MCEAKASKGRLAFQREKNHAEIRVIYTPAEVRPHIYFLSVSPVLGKVNRISVSPFPLHCREGEILL